MDIFLYEKNTDRAKKVYVGKHSIPLYRLKLVLPYLNNYFGINHSFFAAEILESICPEKLSQDRDQREEYLHQVLEAETENETLIHFYIEKKTDEIWELLCSKIDERYLPKLKESELSWFYYYFFFFLTYVLTCASREMKEQKQEYKEFNQKLIEIKSDAVDLLKLYILSKKLEQKTKGLKISYKGKDSTPIELTNRNGWFFDMFNSYWENISWIDIKDLSLKDAEDTLKHVETNSKEKDATIRVVCCGLFFFFKHFFQHEGLMPVWLRKFIDSYLKFVNLIDEDDDKLLSESYIWNLIRPYYDKKAYPRLASYNPRHGLEY